MTLFMAEKTSKKPKNKEVKKAAPAKGTAIRKKGADGHTGADEYGAGQITVLEGLEPVRRRPGMYIGSTGPQGLHHLIWEVVDNSIDEAMGGFCNKIIITLLPDNMVSVEDNGRGIPVVNALSIYTKAEVRRDNKVWEQEYKIGRPQGKVKSTGTTRKRGTVI